jgi:hypothetical protein
MEDTHMTTTPDPIDPRDPDPSRPGIFRTAADYARKLGIAEGSLVMIAAIADNPGTDLAAALRDISEIAQDCLYKTGRAQPGLAEHRSSLPEVSRSSHYS